MFLWIYSVFVSTCSVRDVQIVSLHAAQCWCWCWCWGGVSQRGSADQTVGVSLWCVRMELTPFCLTLCEYKLWHFFTFWEKICCWQIFSVSGFKNHWLPLVISCFWCIVFVRLFIDQYSRLSCCFFLFVSSLIPSVLFHSLYFTLFISLCHFLFICYLTFYLSHWFLLRSVSVLPLPPSTSVQFVSGWTPTSLSSSGMTTSFWPARITRTPPAGLWGGKHPRVVSEPAPPAGAPCPPAPAPAAPSATSTQPTAACTGVSLQTGRRAMPSTSPSLVLRATLETRADWT